MSEPALLRSNAMPALAMRRTLHAIYHPTRTLRKQVLTTPCGRRMARAIPICGNEVIDKNTLDRFTALAHWQGCTVHGAVAVRLPPEEE